MKTKIITFIILSFSSSFNLFACDCKHQGNLKVLQKIEFDNSECIFIAEVLKIDPETNTFIFKVMESFSENSIDNIQIGVYDEFCGPTINEKGRWLIYGNFDSENRIKINHCGLSRSFKNPENNIMVLPAPLLKPDLKINRKERDKEQSDYKRRAQKIAQEDLKSEISNLRSNTK